MVLHQPNDAGTNTYPLCNPFLFCRIDAREDANTHKAIACKHLSNNICTVVVEWHQGYFSSTHFELVTLMAQKVWRLWVLVSAHDRHSHAGNYIGLLSNAGLFFFPLVTIPFPPSTPLIPFRFLTTAPVPILPCLASKFRNRCF